MTEKLYYKDAYINAFTATVLSCIKEGEHYLVELDKTAFFPEEGGQYADSGFISGEPVLDVQEREGIIYHYIAHPADVSETVECSINFEQRYEKMRCHTAEHIVSGIIHTLFGFDNVGFHLSRDYVTFDFNGVMTREMLDEAELLSNKIVAENIQVKAYFPEKEELSTLEYRSKLDLKENVRIVTIGDYDSCACCAPHVAFTGEIGIIKLLDFERHKGGVRIYLQAGKGALMDYRNKYAAVKKISELLSAPQSDVAREVDRLLGEQEDARQKLKALGLRLAAAEARSVTATEGNAVYFLPDFSMDELREFSRLALPRIGGMLVLLSGSEGNYKYVISSNSIKLDECVKQINSALLGRGGGRAEMIQGSFGANMRDIKDYFEK